MPLWKNKALNLTEAEILYVMSQTRSNSGAARFVGCNYDTWKKYATRYIDEETGKTLFEKHKNQFGRGIPKVFKNTNSFYKKYDIFDILAGKHPKYDRKRLARRLIDECILEDKCAQCGFEERRITDFKIPLLLTWVDGDITNHKRENLEFLCYNCYFLSYGNLSQIIDKQRVSFEGF